MTRAAVFTLGKDEFYHLPQWYYYYSQHFACKDMYVLDHDSHDPFVRKFLGGMEIDGVTVRHLKHDTVFDHPWLLEQVHGMQRELLGRYDYVLYTDTDELVVPRDGTLKAFLAEATLPAYRCLGYDIIENQMYRYPFMDKTLLAKVPLTWDYGYHGCTPAGEYGVNPLVGGDLYLYHLHRLDFDQAWAKSLRWRQHQFDQEALNGGFSLQNHPMEIDKFREWFSDTFGNSLEPWHERLRLVLEGL